MANQKLYLVTGYPTIIDPDTKYALGLVTATSLSTAKIAVIDTLASGGLDVGSSETSLVQLSEWDTTVPGVQLFYS